MMRGRLVRATLLVALLGVSTSAGPVGASSVRHRLQLTLTSPEYSILDVDESGLVGSPDGHVTFFREGGAIRFWTPLAGGLTTELATTNFVDLHAMSDPPVFVLSPSGGSAFDSDYAGGSKVLRLAGGRLAMLYHGEHHLCAGNQAEVAIGLATSDDDGVTWVRQGEIITAPAWTPAPCDERTFYGAGSFSAVVSPDREYLYLYFNQWRPDESGVTRVARARLDSGLGPGTWTKYYRGSWTQPGLGGMADDILPVPDTPADQFERAVAIPTVSWNTTYGMWLAVYVSITGFWYSSSVDGLVWNEPRQLFGGVVLFAPASLVDHQQYIYYPSLISVDANEDGRTTDTGLLLYAQGGWTSAHHMVARDLIITREIDPTLPPTGATTSWWPWALVMVGAGAVLQRLATSRSLLRWRGRR